MSPKKGPEKWNACEPGEFSLLLEWPVPAKKTPLPPSPKRAQKPCQDLQEVLITALARGRKKQHIARELERSPSFVSQNVTFLSLKKPLRKAYETGLVRDKTLLAMLARQWKHNPGRVTRFLAQRKIPVTRTGFLAFCTHKKRLPAHKKAP